MYWILGIVAVVLVIVFWTPIRRLLGRAQDEADSFSRQVAEGDPLATLGRGITENQKALDKRIEAIGQWDALVRTTTSELHKTQEELEDIKEQLEDRFKQHEEESTKASSDATLLRAIEEDVDRLASARELKQEHATTLQATLENYQRELKEREAELYEISDAIEQAKRVHQAGQVKERLDQIEQAARAAGKNVGIEGVSAAETLRDLVSAVKQNETARKSATEYKRRLTRSEGPKDPRLIERDREARIKSTFDRLRAERKNAG